MKEFTYVIKDALGLHARPAGLLAKAALAYKCDIKLTARDKTVDAKRIMGIMGLGAKKDDELKITFDGVDEDVAAAEIEKFVKEHI